MGIVLTLPMHIRIVAEDAKICFAFAKRGLSMEGCSSWFLPRLVGPGKAWQWLFAAPTFLAKEERHSALFNYVVPASEVINTAMALAREISSKSATSVATSSFLIKQGLTSNTPDTMHTIESACFHWMAQRRDFVEGVANFLQNRPSDFQDKVSLVPFGTFSEKQIVPSKL
eukprot:TRINITY_DN5996_c0_g1_i4.p1 TRINITY_DN5996_c0_g1~~TRINITY_DN5996_c0_g1_i4.p1  ORF type:complete len:171 (-),score=26.99 TRINITY_DN5996_c0_g1_i4:33-545(-)